MRENGSTSKRLAVGRSKIYGRGCFALVPFNKRKKIATYAGETIRGKRKIEARLDKQEAIKIIQITPALAIDGAVGGDETAFINHSCGPNAYMRVVPGDKVAIFALRDIAPGEEITINYRDPQHPPASSCKCGADNCRSLAARSRAEQG